MRRKTSRSYRQLNRNFSHTIQRLGSNRHIPRSPLNVQHSCLRSGHNTWTAMSKVLLLISCLDQRAIEALIAGRARIHLSIERWRVCETWFAPSMAGVDSAGLGEVLQNVLASFSLSDRGLLVQVLTSVLPPFPLRPVSHSFLSRYLPCSSLNAERVPNGYAGAGARALGTPSCDAAADPPARDATPDRVCGGPVPRCMAGNGRVCTDGGIRARWRDEGRVR